MRVTFCCSPLPLVLKVQRPLGERDAFDRFEQAGSVGLVGGELQLGGQRIDGDVVLLHAGAFGFHRVVLAAVLVIEADGAGGLVVLGELRGAGRDVVDDPVRLDVAGAGDVPNVDHERLRPFGSVLPFDRR